MKLGLVTAAIVLALSGCGSTKSPTAGLDAGQVTPINAQIGRAHV